MYEIEVKKLRNKLGLRCEQNHLFKHLDVIPDKLVPSELIPEASDETSELESMIFEHTNEYMKKVNRYLNEEEE